METINQQISDREISDRLKDFKFRRIRHSTPADDSADLTTSPETPFTTVPHFHTRAPWQISTTAAFEFLRRLPIIPPLTLSEGKRVCLICHEPYIRPQSTEMPTILPCQHIFGRKCIAQWIIPSCERPNKTCPLCRSDLFNEETVTEALNSSIEEIDSAEWINETRRLLQDAPHAGLRLEFVVRDLERIGTETILRTRTAIAADIAGLRATVARYGEMVREQERRIVELFGPLQGLRERLREADWAEFERLDDELVMLQDTARMLREVFPVVTGMNAVDGTDEGGE